MMVRRRPSSEEVDSTSAPDRAHVDQASSIDVGPASLLDTQKKLVKKSTKYLLEDGYPS